MSRRNYFERLEKTEFDARKELNNIKKLLDKTVSVASYYSLTDFFRKKFEVYPIQKRLKFDSFDDVISRLLKDEYDSDNDCLFVFVECILDYFYELTKDISPIYSKITTLYNYRSDSDFDSDIYNSEYDRIVDKLDSNHLFTSPDRLFECYDPLFVQFSKIKVRIDTFLEELHYQLVTDEHGRQIIVEKNVYASEVSQIISVNNFQDATKVLEYNHFSNKGNLSRKREILKSLADYLEPLRKELNADGKLPEVLCSQNKKIIAIEKLFEMYNNLGVRHNNDKQYSNEFSEEEMEQWYDDIYTSTLFVILSLEESRILSNLEGLKNSQAH